MASAGWAQLALALSIFCSETHKLINPRSNCEIVVSQVGARRDNPNCDTSSLNVSRDIFDVAKNPDIDIVVELIGGTTIARDLVMTALENGKHVVTANKALIAEHGMEIFAYAESRNLIVAYEAAVAGGIPIIKGLARRSCRQPDQLDGRHY